MSYVPHPTSTLHIANAAQVMARNADHGDAKLFQKVVLVTMGVMAVASVGTMLIGLLHELNRRHDQQSSRGR